MIDYGKMADDLKVQQQGADNAAISEEQQLEKMCDFFKNVKLTTGQEIERANPELEKRGLLKDEYMTGVTMYAESGGSTLVLRFGLDNVATAQFIPEDYRFEVSVQGDSETNSNAVETDARFVFKFSGSDLQVLRETSGSDASSQSEGVEAQGIAELLVSSVIRGRLG